MIDHFWWTGRHTYTWPAPVGDRLARDFTPDDLRPELEALRHRRHRADPGPAPGRRARPRNSSISVERVDFVRGVVGWLPLADPDATAHALERLRGRRQARRRAPSHQQRAGSALAPAGRVVESLRLLAAAGLAFDAIPINAAQFESVLDVARRLPELKIVMNHLGRPPIPEQGWEPWATQIARAAEHRNIAMKLSIGLDIIMRWRWSTDQRPPLQRSCARPVRSRARHGGEQLARDPVGRDLRGNLAGHSRAHRRAFPRRHQRAVMGETASASTACRS